jgi:hypothetical protein
MKTLRSIIEQLEIDLSETEDVSGSVEYLLVKMPDDAKKIADLINKKKAKEADKLRANIIKKQKLDKRSAGELEKEVQKHVKG